MLYCRKTGTEIVTMKKRVILTVILYIAFALLTVLCFKLAIMMAQRGKSADLSLWALLPAISLACAFALAYFNKKLSWLHPIVLTLIAVLVGIKFGMRYDAPVLYFFAAYALLAAVIGSGSASLVKQRKEMKNTAQ